MKKNITKLVIAYISLAIAPSIFAETLTLKTGADNVITEWWNWSDTSKWSPTVSEVAGNDLTLNYKSRFSRWQRIHKYRKSGNARIF